MFTIDLSHTFLMSHSQKCNPTFDFISHGPWKIETTHESWTIRTAHCRNSQKSAHHPICNMRLTPELTFKQSATRCAFCLWHILKSQLATQFAIWRDYRTGIWEIYRQSAMHCRTLWQSLFLQSKHTHTRTPKRLSNTARDLLLNLPYDTHTHTYTHTRTHTHI